MTRRLLLAVAAWLLLSWPSQALAFEPPTIAWNAEGTKVTVSGACDAQANILLIYLYYYSEAGTGPSFGADCVDNGQGGHFSATFPTPGDFPYTLSPGDAIFVWDNFDPPEGPAESHVPPYVPSASVPVPALGTLAPLGLLAAALLILGARRGSRIHRVT